MMKNLSKIFLIVTAVCIALYIGVFIGRIGMRNTTNLSNAAYTEDKDFQKIDLNTATAEELAQIPGLHKDVAKAIVDYRIRYGRYYKVKELLDVDGVTRQIYDTIKDYVTIID